MPFAVFTLLDDKKVIQAMKPFFNIDFTKELLEGGEKFVAGSVRQNIKSGKDVKGVAFQALKESTVKAKKRKGSRQPKKPLVDTGTLRDQSIKAIEQKKNVVKVHVFNKKRIKIALIHNKGQGNMPQREFWGVADNNKDKVTRQVMNILRKKIVRLTGGGL